MNYEDMNELQKLAFEYGYETEMEKQAGKRWDSIKGSVTGAYNTARKRAGEWAQKGKEKFKPVGEAFQATQFRRGWANRGKENSGSVKDMLQGGAKTVGAYGTAAAAVGGAGYGGYSAYKNRNKK